MSILRIASSFSYIFPLTGETKDKMRGFGLQGTASPADRDSSFLYGGMSVSFSF
jgi:hypothetical protein